MKHAACLLLVAACASEPNHDPGDENPTTLWLAQGSGGTMKLVAAEPKPY